MKVKNVLFVACSLVLSLSSDTLFAVSSSSSSSSIEAEMSELANPAGKRVCVIGACPGALSWEQEDAVEKVEELARATEKTVFVDSYTPCTNNHVTVINQDLNALDAADNLIRQDVRDMDLAITDYCVYYFLKEDRLIDLLKLVKIGGHLLVGPVGGHCSNPVSCFSDGALEERLQRLMSRNIHTADIGLCTMTYQQRVAIGWHLGRKTEPTAVKAALEQNNAQISRFGKIAFYNEGEQQTSGTDNEQRRKDMIFEYLDYAAAHMTKSNLESYISRGWGIETSVTTWDVEAIKRVADSYLGLPNYDLGRESVWVDIKKLGRRL